MRLISWNVNGIRAVLGKGLLEWMGKEQADVFCFQETKANPGQLGQELLDVPGYKCTYMSAEKKGYSGTAAYFKEEPISISNMGCPEFDCEGRGLLLEYPGFTLMNCYFPNSQEGGARLQYKLDFCDAVLDICNGLVAKGKNVIVCGDYNIAHERIDLARPDDNENNAGFLPEERAWMSKYLGAGYIDAFRHFDKSAGKYTWWSYRAGARPRNIGWRIDYHCFNKAFLPCVKEAAIHSDVMGSDHCPISIIVE